MNNNIEKQLFIAGLEGNQQKLTEIWQGQDFSQGDYIKLSKAFEIYDNGDKERLKAKNNKPFVWTRDYLDINTAIDQMLNKATNL